MHKITFFMCDHADIGPVKDKTEKIRRVPSEVRPFNWKENFPALIYSRIYVGEASLSVTENFGLNSDKIERLKDLSKLNQYVRYMNTPSYPKTEEEELVEFERFFRIDIANLVNIWLYNDSVKSSVEPFNFYYQEVLIPVFRFILQKRSEAFSVAFKLAEPVASVLSEQVHAARYDRNYPDRERILKVFDEAFARSYHSEGTHYFFFSDHFFEVMHLTREKHKELADQFFLKHGLDFDKHEGKSVLSGLIPGHMTSYQLEMLIVQAFFASPWSPVFYYEPADGVPYNFFILGSLSPLYLLFTSAAPLYDYMQLEYIEEYFRKQLADKCDFILLTRPLRGKENSNLLLYVRTKETKKMFKFAVDVNITNVSEYEVLIKKRDFSSEVFLARLRNHDIDSFIIITIGRSSKKYEVFKID
jgi:hypothetical protein